jgi:tetratricopeptide (TPR) repeat protein
MRIGDYDDAISTGRRFVQLYPADADAAYAQYLVGMSYYNQIPDVTRDQERTEKALIALDEVVRKWPKSEYANDAKQRVMVARDQLAGKEMDVGRYYLKQRNYTGAVNRFREVLVRYQTTRHVEEALMRIAEAYMALGIVPEAQTASAVLGHNFPDSPWYKNAYDLLQSGGTAPREKRDRGSASSSAALPALSVCDRGGAGHAGPAFDPRYCPDRPARPCVRAGFSVLTGETGAGKSILLDAFALALGGRGRWRAWCAMARRRGR